MSPDDPRHSTVAGYRAGCREVCCRSANARYSNQRRLAILNGRSLRVDGIGTRRRIEALRCMGWTLERIALEAGWNSLQAVNRAASRAAVSHQTHERIARVYERLCMTPGPSDAGRRMAQRMGYAPPLAWDDIDNPDEMPSSLISDADDDGIDPVVVDRLLAGERIRSTNAEKVEAMRRWTREGGSERSLCDMHGWRAGRYMTREDAA